MQSTLVLIPTYNEKHNLHKMITTLRDTIPADILIIDDNSPDGTGILADELTITYPGVHVLHRQKKEGFGAAYIFGYTWALQKEYDLFIQMDCDFSHDPQYIPEMLKIMKDNDLIQGSRYGRGISCCNWPLHRVLLSKLANVSVELLTGMKIKDATSGFKIFTRKVLKNINISTIKSKGYSFNVEIIYRAYKLGYRIHEFPIIFYERKVGTSKISFQVILEYFFLIFQIFLGLYRFYSRESKNKSLVTELEK